jgi:sulfur carrier protein
MRIVLKMGRAAADADSQRTGHNVRMQILLNGQDRDLPPGTTLGALLVAESLAGRRVAVEVNGEIVPRGRHATHMLRDDDRVEIVHALGGG